MPMAARLHSEGRVLMAAGNQRASMMKSIRGQKNEQKKRLGWDIQKALEGVPTIGGGTGHSVPLIRCADKFILMQLQCINFAVSPLAVRS
jgi:hypothetical protein